MIAIKEVRLENYLRFRGEHRAVLVPGVYGLTARWDDNPMRSNWAGKTAVLEAVPLALYGWHRKRTEDEWITTGAKVGSVAIVLDVDGRDVVVERRRARGSSTKLTVSGAGEKPLKGDEAQLFIANLLCMTEKDFFATSYIGQKQMSRFVTMKPEERMGLVVEWLRLHKLEAAAAEASARLGAALDVQTREEVELSTATSAIRDIAMACGYAEEAASAASQSVAPMALLADLDQAVALAEDRLEQARSHVELFEEQRKRQVQHARDYADAQEFHRVAAMGKALASKLAGMDGDSLKLQAKTCRDRMNEVIGEQRVMCEKVRQLQVVARGKFDGDCPACPGFECPAAADINDDRAKSAKALAEAQGRHEGVLARRKAAEKARDDSQALVDAIYYDATELDRLKTEARRLRPAAERVARMGEPMAELPEHDADLAQAQQRVEACAVELDRMKRERARAKDCVEKANNLRGELGRTRDHVELLRAAQQVLGRNGAQREIARRMLEEVEAAANAALADCGVDLRVQIRWSHEGGGLAKSCDSCGAAFPASQRVKACARCGAERGPLLVNKLEVVLSDQSGAAEDLAGAAIQLAAMAWLREERGSPWSVALIDEPFGSLDEQHRGALAAHLSGMLAGRYGVMQALIIAHHAAVMDALPCRLEVLAGQDGSRIGEVDDGSVRHGDGRGGDARGAGAPPAAGAANEGVDRATGGVDPQGDGGSGSGEGGDSERDVPVRARPRRRKAAGGEGSGEAGGPAGGRAGGK